jgi:hypothetical protein
MLLIDDILFFPLRGIFWIAREVHNAAQEELANEVQSVTAELSTLYMMLETGQISEEEFQAQESRWLARLDQIESRGAVETEGLLPGD